MPQAHCFLATELVLKAQKQAQKIDGVNPQCDDCHETDPRRFIKTAGRERSRPASIAADFPPSSRRRCSGPSSPSNRINVGAIGTGRISRGHDLPGVWRHDIARIMAVCDLDSKRVAGREGAGQRAVREEDRQTVRRRDDLYELSRAAGEQGRRRRRHQHARSLAHAHRDRCGRSGQGPLSAEARLADDCRRACAQQRRAPIGPYLSDRKPAALVAAISIRGGARAQRSHRSVEDRGGGSSRRSCGRRGARHAGSEAAQLRDVAGLDARRAVHREACASAERATTGRAGCVASSSAPG